MPNISLDPTVAEYAIDILLPSGDSDNAETLGSLRKDVLEEIDRDSDIIGDDPDRPDYSRLDKWINRAYMDLATSLELQESEASFTLVTKLAASTYVIPSSIRAIKELGMPMRDMTTRMRSLLKMDVGEFRAAANFSGEVKYYGTSGRTLFLWPIPDRVYTITGSAIIGPDKMQSAGESPLVPAELHEAILLGAKARAYKFLKEDSRSQDAFAGYRAFLRGKLDRRAQEDRGKIIGVSVPRRKQDLQHGTTTGWPRYIDRGEF